MKPTGNLVADTICHTARIGLTITDAADTSVITIIDATSVTVSNTYPKCGHPGKLHDHILRRLANLPTVGFPSHLDVRIPRLLCIATSCPRKIFQTSLACVGDGSKLTHHITCWILQRLVIDRMSVSATAKALDIGQDLVSQVALNTCCQPVYDDPHHLDGVRILGIDERVQKHIRKPGQPSNLVTILVDLAPLTDGRDPARLLDLCPGRSTEVLHTWLQERDPSSRSQVQVIAMDDLIGYASVVDQILPGTTKVMDPFHVVYLAADKLTGCRQ